MNGAARPVQAGRTTHGPVPGSGTGPCLYAAGREKRISGTVRGKMGGMEEKSTGYDHVWWWRSRLPERKGQRCRVLVRARRMNTILVEFEDGFRVVTSRYAVRRVTGKGARDRRA